MTLFGGRAFKNAFKVKWSCKCEPTPNRASALIRRGTGSLFHHTHRGKAMWGLSIKVAICNQARGASLETSTDGTYWTSSLQTEKITCLLCKPPKMSCSVMPVQVNGLERDER